MQKIIYYSGNGTDPKDNLPHLIIIKLKERFPGILFMHFDPTDTSLMTQNPVIIDTVIGIKKIKLFNKLQNFELSPRNSVHDYDLTVDLGLLLKLKKIRSFTIIGIPENYKVQKAIEDIEKIFKDI